jgi:hypothetical protein
MKVARQMAKAFLVLFFLFDALIAWQLWRHGPPMVMSDWKEIKPGEVSFRMAKAPVAAHDYIALTIAVTLHVALLGFLWWSGKRIARN